jgi:hypothetical protein
MTQNPKKKKRGKPKLLSDKYKDEYGNIWTKVRNKVWNDEMGWGNWDSGKGLTNIKL